MLGWVVVSMLAAAPGKSPVTAEALRSHVRFLASDLLEGRGPGTRGDELAQAYLSSQFEGLGLSSVAVDGGWVQPVPLVGVEGHPDALSVLGPDGGALRLAFKDDFIVVSGHQRPASKVQQAELVFVGYGIVAPEYQWDDFKGLDLKGKIAVVLNNDPEDDPSLFGGRARLWYGRWDYKYEQAAKHGAAGCLIVHTTPSAGYPWQVVQTSWTGVQFGLPNAPHELELKGWLTEGATRRLLAFGGQDWDALRSKAQGRSFRPTPLGVKLSASFVNAITQTRSANVLAALPGADPRLKNEWIVLTAHHDHLGVKADAKPGEDAIYNGAVDNAAGVAALLVVAKALAQDPKRPKRSVLFAAVAAEEQGLLGSEWLVSSPPVPLAQLVANVNVDGLNTHGRTRDVSVIGFGKSTIDGVLAELARAQGRVLRPDAMSDRGFFYRSDQLNFARRGIPAAYFASGQDFIGKPSGWGAAQVTQWESERYHQPQDELREDWDWSGAVEDVELVLGLVRRLGDAAKAPSWHAGDEFEHAR